MTKVNSPPENEGPSSARASIPSLVGWLTVTVADEAVIAVDWGQQDVTAAGSTVPVLDEALSQLEAYFAGHLQVFDLPLNPAGSTFQRQVYDQMLAIPYGETRTYGDLAQALDTYGQPVGQACGSNPIPVIIPCHRVLSAQGMGGYSGRGGIETKAELLKHEGGFPFLL